MIAGPGPGNHRPTVENPLSIQKSNTKVDARVGIGSADRVWTLEAWVTNLTDEQTRNVTFNVPLRTGARGAFQEAPRMWGLTLRTEF